MISNPSPRRRIVALLFFAAAGLLVVAVKRTRGTDDAFLPAWMAGAFPNFACAAFGPMVIFFSTRTFRYRDFALFVLLLAVGLCGYEVQQTMMKNRTFDMDDIAATWIGAALALAIGIAFFRRDSSITPPF
jgi:glycopeptide antibiotics resistance protein